MTEKLINPVSKGEIESRYEEGQRVEAEYRESGHWFVGVVSRVRLDGTYDVTYDDGEVEASVPEELIRSNPLLPLDLDSLSLDSAHLPPEQRQKSSKKVAISVTAPPLDTQPSFSGGQDAGFFWFRLDSRAVARSTAHSESPGSSFSAAAADVPTDSFKTEGLTRKVDPKDFFTSNEHAADFHTPSSSERQPGAASAAAPSVAELNASSADAAAPQLSSSSHTASGRVNESVLSNVAPAAMVRAKRPTVLVQAAEPAGQPPEEQGEEGGAPATDPSAEGQCTPSRSSLMLRAQKEPLSFASSPTAEDE